MFENVTNFIFKHPYILHMKRGLVILLYNFGKRFMGWTLHMIMCVLLCYPVSIRMSQLQSTGRPISSSLLLSPAGL